VEGIWDALVFDERRTTWYDWVLVVHRSDNPSDGNAAGPLEGTITAHYWGGGAGQEKPPACAPGRHEETVKMPAHGSIDAQGNVLFGSSSYTVESVACGTTGSYAPDNFSGKIDTALQEFISVNNDGKYAVNEPAVFRRIRCIDAPSRGTAKAKPPAFAPPKHGWSCGK
jgi:hypothetical protein